MQYDDLKNDNIIINNNINNNDNIVNNENKDNNHNKDNKDNNDNVNNDYKDINVKNEDIIVKKNSKSKSRGSIINIYNAKNNELNKINNI